MNNKITNVITKKKKDFNREERRFYKQYENEESSATVIPIGEKHLNIEKKLNEYKFPKDYDKYKKSFSKLILVLKEITTTTEDFIKQVEKKALEVDMKNSNITFNETYYHIRKISFTYTPTLEEIKKYENIDETTPLFTSFYTLSSILTAINELTKEDKINSIIYLIKQNLELLKNKRACILNEVHQIEKKISDNLLVDNELLYSYNLEKVKEVIKDPDFINDFKNATETIEKHYIEKDIDKDYIPDDIQKVTKALTKLQITPQLIELFQTRLKKIIYNKKDKKKNTPLKIEKKAVEVLPFTRIKINPLEQSSIKIKEKPIEIVPYTIGKLPPNEIKKKQLKTLRTTKELIEEVKKYIDLYEFRLKKEVLPKEKFYIMNLLSSLNKGKEEIRTFISIADLNIENLILKSDLNILRKIFAENREKYYFYYQIKGYTQLEESIHFLEESFDLLATENDIDFRKALTTEIRQELITLENSLPATYEYEFREIEKQNLKKKGKNKNEKHITNYDKRN